MHYYKRNSIFAPMKKLMYLVVCLVMISCSTEKKEKAAVIKPSIENTELKIINMSSDSITGYLTLSGYPESDTVHVKDVYKIFGIKERGLVGIFHIAKGDSVSYISTKWLSGNISFGGQPINCFSEVWPTGINPFEFNLNNDQESIDISAMGGVNCIMQIELIGGPKWQASPKYPDVRYFYNDSMWRNSGLIGVYPYGCPNCTDTIGKQLCQFPTEQPDSEPICTPTRSANVRGGQVIVKFIGYTNN